MQRVKRLVQSHRVTQVIPLAGPIKLSVYFLPLMLSDSNSRTKSIANAAWCPSCVCPLSLLNYCTQPIYKLPYSAKVVIAFTNNNQFEQKARQFSVLLCNNNAMWFTKMMMWLRHCLCKWDLLPGRKCTVTLFSLFMSCKLTCKYRHVKLQWRKKKEICTIILWKEASVKHFKKCKQRESLVYFSSIFS